MSSYILDDFGGGTFNFPFIHFSLFFPFVWNFKKLKQKVPLDLLMCIVFGLQLCMNMVCVSGACKGQKGALALLEPSLQTVVSHHVLLVINSRSSVRATFFF